MHGIIASERSGVDCAHARVLAHIAKYSYAYLELRRALKLRVFIGHSSAECETYIYIEKSGRLGSLLADNFSFGCVGIRNHKGLVTKL